MFIWDFVAETVLGEIIDWFYGQGIGFLAVFSRKWETWVPTYSA
jgi:hypothetical protein